METKDMENYSSRTKWVQLVLALAFIVTGLMFLGRNLGIVDPHWFNIIISWQMLLIVVAVVNFVRGHIWAGFIVLMVGISVLLPKIMDGGDDILFTYWPLIFVFVGIGILFKRQSRFSFDRPEQKKRNNYAQGAYTSDNGFVVSDNTFGSVKQVVLDPVFKGAHIRNTFGGTVLDLRRTKLEAPRTYIDVESFFSGIEIYLPSGWNLKSEVTAIIGGCEDKRYNVSEIDPDHVLIVRGSILFGGLEFKN